MGEEAWNVVLGVMLGWLLGLLGPSITKGISESKERDNLIKIVLNDLKELKKRLAPLPFRVYPKYGKLDQKTFEWLKINSGIDYSDTLEKLQQNGIGEDQLLDYLNAKGLRESSTVYFKKMHLFATDSHLLNFGVIDKDLMANILEVRFHVESFNEDVESFREDLKMTFLPDITVENHIIISQEIDNRSLKIAETAIFIVDKINNILNSNQKK